MSCCGKKREQMLKVQPAATRGSSVLFEYTGATGLSIVGPVSRTGYRFDRPGARVIIDSRDQRSLAAVPQLRQVSW